MMSTARQVAGIVLLVIAGLLVPVAVVSTWAARTVTDTDAFVERVSPVVAQVEVQEVLEQQITDTVDTVVIEGLVGSRVDTAIDDLDAPPVVKVLLRNLAGSAGGWVTERVERVAHKVVTAPQFQDAFRESLAVAHEKLVVVLEGDGDAAVVAEDGTVSIKVATITNAVREELADAGLDVAGSIPAVEASIPIATVDQLDRWRGWYRVLEVLVWLGPLLVVVLAGAGLWLYRRPAAAGAWFAGAGTVGVLGVTWVARSVVDGAASGILDPASAAAARAVVRTVTASLQSNAHLALVLLLLLLAASVAVLLRPRLIAALEPT